MLLLACALLCLSVVGTSAPVSAVPEESFGGSIPSFHDVQRKAIRNENAFRDYSLL